jgi:shikimate kinase
MHIFFTGFMGVGKTTIGKEVADLLQIPFIDLDNEIEQYEDSSISEIFSTKGEDYFREIESNLLHQVVKKQSATSLIALGGGTMCHLNNHSFILKQGVTVYLKKTWEDWLTSYQTIEDRPKLADKSLESIFKLYQQREPIYALAQLETLVNTSFSTKNLANRLKLLTNR